MISLQTGSQVELGKTKIGSKVSRAWPGEKNKRLFYPQATLGLLGSPIFFFALVHLGACSQATIC